MRSPFLFGYAKPVPVNFRALRSARCDMMLAARSGTWPLPTSALHERRFPSPWSVDEADSRSFIVRDANGQALAYIYFEDEPGRRASLVRSNGSSGCFNVGQL